MEYGYAQAPKKDEIEGMSGGGIFDDLLRLVGLHKRSSVYHHYSVRFERIK